MLRPPLSKASPQPLTNHQRRWPQCRLGGPQRNASWWTRNATRQEAVAPRSPSSLLTGAIFGALVYYYATRDRLPEGAKEGKTRAAEDSQVPGGNAKEKAGSWKGLDFLKPNFSAASFTSSMPEWSWPASLNFPALQTRLSDFFAELSMGPGSLYAEIVEAPPDSAIHPEVEWDADVRLGDELCVAERAFLVERKRVMRAAFARLFGVDEKDVDERDLPIVAIAGSGGGFRATLNTIGSLTGADTAGILPCVTYTAGVSGSCWALSVLHSGVAGSTSPRTVGQHIKERIQTSYLDMSTLDALITPPTNKYLLSSLLLKAASPKGVVSLVDVYGTLLSSRIFTPSDLTKLDPQHLSLHLSRRTVDRGQQPLPIYTAIQHTIPPVAVQAIHELQSERMTAASKTAADRLERAEGLVADSNSRFLWYEFTPYEIGCDEIGAWIPSWAFGREFEAGRSIDRRPEMGLTILAGIYGSAFCASLKLYFKEIQPALELLPSPLYNWLRDIVTENEKDLGLIHPVLPNQVPNFLKGLEGSLRSESPTDLADRDYMTFMDAGAELNLPYYPLLRRNVDCIIALDASADSQALWFTRAEELAAKRGLRTWPRGASWPAQVQPTHLHAAEEAEKKLEDEAAGKASRKLAESQETALADQTKKESSPDKDTDTPPPSSSLNPARLRTCEVWIGSSDSNVSDDDTTRLDDLDEDALLRRDGIGVVYIPLAPHEERVPGFDPFVVSTWRREVEAEQSQKVLDVAEANFIDSREKIVRLLRAIWMRKKRERTQKEWRSNLAQFQKDFWHHTE